MEDAELRLDGNAVAGLLGEIFVVEATTVRGTCAACGASGALGRVVVYAHAPGVVLRCPECDSVLMRVVRTESRLWLDARGVASLELPAGE
jgi:hypothetical protein